MKLLKKLMAATAMLAVSTSTLFAAAGDWPTNPQDGDKTDPIGGVVYIWRAAEMAWEVWDVTLPSKGGTGLESPTAGQVMVTNGDSPMELISYTTLKERIGLEDGDNVGHIPITTLPVITNNNLVIGTGTGMTEITPSALKILLSIDQIVNLDFTDASNITRNHLPLAVMPAVTDDSFLLGTGTGMEELTVPAAKILLGIQNMVNLDFTDATNITKNHLSIGVMPAVTNNSILVGNGTGMAEQTPSQYKATLSLENVENFGTATKLEAEAGTAANKFMTPQRTKEAIDSQRAFATNTTAIAGTETTTVLSPALLKAVLESLERRGTATERNALPLAERTPGLRWYDTTADRYYYVNSAQMWMAL